MRKNIVDLVGFLLTAVACAAGVVMNILTLANGEDTSMTAQAIAFLVAFAVIFGISVHLAIVRILRIVKDREINKEDK